MSAFIIAKGDAEHRVYIDCAGNQTSKRNVARRWDTAFEAWAWLINRCSLQFKRTFRVVRLRPPRGPALRGSPRVMDAADIVVLNGEVIKNRLGHVVIVNHTLKEVRP